MPSCCSANGIECQSWRLSLRRLPLYGPNRIARDTGGYRAYGLRHVKAQAHK